MKTTRREVIRRTFFGGLLAALGAGVAKKALATPPPIKADAIKRLWTKGWGTVTATFACGHTLTVPAQDDVPQWVIDDFQEKVAGWTCYKCDVKEGR